VQLIQLSKYEIKIQMDFNVIDSVINAVLFAQQKTVSGVVSDGSGTLPGVENVVIREFLKSSAQTNLMENTLLKAKNRRCSSILFRWNGGVWQKLVVHQLLMCLKLV
jgi:hypothetical protein